MYSETYSRDFLPALMERIRPSDSILDVGSGIGLLLQYYECPIILALDAHRPYLENRVNRSPHIIPINADARDMGKMFVPKSVSTVAFIDSIEHFTKPEGLALLHEAEIIAKSRVVVFTPRGFFPQNHVDHYGMSGEFYQSHRSGWEPEEFLNRGYYVLVFKHFHDAANPAFVQALGSGHPPVDAILAVKYLG
ncbi:class I SAM-dependent methyltransferase [Paenibacillus sp. P25]|nr:class I SAM-dependent methyltransferase [Paenibacillus sp. P25]